MAIVQVMSWGPTAYAAHSQDGQASATCGECDLQIAYGQLGSYRTTVAPTGRSRRCQDLCS